MRVLVIEYGIFEFAIEDWKFPGVVVGDCERMDECGELRSYFQQPVRNNE